MNALRPRQPERTRSLGGSALAVAGGLLVAATGLWALAPLQGPDLGEGFSPTPARAPPSPAEPASKPELDLAAFRAPLWVAPPAPLEPETPPPPPAPPAPLNLDLIAIVREGEVYAAILYDRGLDRLRTVRANDPVGGRTVEEVTAGVVHLRGQDGGRSTIALRPARDGSGPP